MKEETRFVVSFAKVGDPLLCVFCGLGIDLENRGVTIMEGPIVVTLPKGDPVCRTCLKAKDPALFESFQKLRMKEDRIEEGIIADEFGARRTRSQRLIAEVVELRRAVSQAQVEFFNEAKGAVLLHPRYLAARRGELAAREGVIVAAEARAVLGEKLGGAKAPRVDPKDRPKAEAQLAAAEQAVTQAKAKVTQAEAETSRVYGELFEELTSGKKAA